MQADGNLVLYDSEGKSLWSSETHGHPGASVTVQEDGNVVIYDWAKTVLERRNVIIYEGTQPIWVAPRYALSKGYQEKDGNGDYQRNFWMARIADDTPLSRITIPGTHDTMTFNLGKGPVKCQDKSLEEQLNEGIRYVDMRCGHEKNRFAMYHGIGELKINFTKVLAVCEKFLNANPSECIVMLITHNKFTYKDISYIFPPPKIDTYGNTDSFELTFDWYVRSGDVPRREDLWYLGDTIPNIGNVRGQIVLLRRFVLDDLFFAPILKPERKRIRNANGTKGIDVTAWQDNTAYFGITTVYTKRQSFKIQDAYEVGLVRAKTPAPPRNCINISDKWDVIERLLDEAKNDSSDTWFINFLAGSTWVNPDDVAWRINWRLRDYINGRRSGGSIPASPSFENRLGTIVLDFPERYPSGNKLIDLIIDANFNRSGCPYYKRAWGSVGGPVCQAQG